ncbi:MAG: acetate--CoA ligase family protein [candidate division Zixibacteria bacterium]|nr:acetate--CoA ligase family protein [candidate division Zixibacteria bacterium]MBU1470050.1 acetate--CoA ligase family protein [candidate division Zixibacteria bacterium]MBU2624370.1 acetate--CoA ligase family protein [candidate division Zixibacteria bacterium]
MLDGLFKPRSVAIIGASNNPLSIGHIVIQNLVDHDFKGPIYPINPKSKVIKSFRTYPSVGDVPDEIDLVNISIKNSLVPAVLEDCGKKGVKFAIVHTAGFKEVGEEGLALEKQIVEIAHKYGMRIYGPNSQGIQNSDPSVSIYANFTFVPMTPGNISIVAQSGGVGETLKLELHRIGIGIRMYSSFGNEADVSMNEIIDYFGQDEETKAIMVHIETLKDPAGFLEVASRVTRKKPILALKTGKTSEGVAAVASHTGSLLEQETLSDAIFEKSGVMRFHSQQEMVEAAISFSTQPIPKSENIVIVTNTGGPAIIAVDECISSGLKLAKLSPDTGKALGELLFSEAIVSNPVDVIATAGAKEYGGAVELLLKDPNTDSLILCFVTPPFVDCEAVARKLAEIGATAEKPIICIILTIEEKFGEVIRLIRESGIPVYNFPESASRALAALIKYGQILRRETPEYVEYKTDNEKAAGIMSRYRGQEKFLPQADVFELLQCYGIPTVKSVRIDTEKDLKKEAQKLKYPLVLKVDAEGIVHKSDAGGVCLNLEDEASLLDAFDRMSSQFKEHKPGFILQEHVVAGTEVIMGAKATAGLGPMLMFGLGGIFVETLKDVQFRLAPLSQQDANWMISSIKGYPILQGARGAKPADIDKLAETLMRLSQLCSDFPEIDEMDLNPVFAFEEGKGVEVVDARLKTSNAG